jgi:hypothetical protein
MVHGRYMRIIATAILHSLYVRKNLLPTYSVTPDIL